MAVLNSDPFRNLRTGEGPTDKLPNVRPQPHTDPLKTPEPTFQDPELQQHNLSTGPGRVTLDLLKQVSGFEERGLDVANRAYNYVLQNRSGSVNPWTNKVSHHACFAVGSRISAAITGDLIPGATAVKGRENARKDPDYTVIETNIGELEEYFRDGGTLPDGAMIFYDAPHHRAGHQTTVINKDGKPHFLSDFNQGSRPQDFYVYSDRANRGKSVTVAIHNSLLENATTSPSLTPQEQEQRFIASVTGNQPLSDRSPVNSRIVSAAAWTADQLAASGILSAEEAWKIKQELGKPSTSLSAGQRSALARLGEYVADDPTLNTEQLTNLGLLVIGHEMLTNHSRSQDFRQIVQSFPNADTGWIEAYMSRRQGEMGVGAAVPGSNLTELMSTLEKLDGLKASFPKPDHVVRAGEFFPVGDLREVITYLDSSLSLPIDGLLTRQDMAAVNQLTGSTGNELTLEKLQLLEKLLVEGGR